MHGARGALPTRESARLIYFEVQGLSLRWLASRCDLLREPMPPGRLLLALASALACCSAASAQQVWTNLWATAYGMDAIDADLTTDEDNTTQMRAFAPIRAGASLSVDLRSAVKITHVVRPPPLLPSCCGCCCGDHSV